jgi:hypothetical protein
MALKGLMIGEPDAGPEANVAFYSTTGRDDRLIDPQAGPETLGAPRSRAPGDRPP